MERVFLGMPGRWADDYREESDHYKTKIGGLPDWPILEMSIDPALLNCRLCGERLCLVAQVYAPISSPTLSIQERVLYILGCLMPKCGEKPSSWRALRVQKCDFEMPAGSTSPKEMDLCESSVPMLKINGSREDCFPINGFGEDSDDSDSDVDLEELGRSLSEAASMASNLKKQNGGRHFEARGTCSVTESRVTNSTIPVVPCFDIWLDEEKPSSDISASCANYSSLSIKESLMDIDGEDEAEYEKEHYEYDKALSADRTYLKFKKRMDAYPEQCFRYSFGGNPLLATIDFVRPDTCAICGSLRHFEIQLMSPLIYFLQQAVDSSRCYSPKQWNWMTLVVYSCSKSCCPSRCQQKSSRCCWEVVEEAIFIHDE